MTKFALCVIALLAGLVALSVEFDFGPRASAQPGEIEPVSAPVGPDVDGASLHGGHHPYVRTERRPAKYQARDFVGNKAFAPEDNFMSSVGKYRLDAKEATGKWMTWEEAKRAVRGNGSSAERCPTASSRADASVPAGRSAPAPRTTTRHTGATHTTTPPVSPAPSAATTPTTETANSIEPAAVESPAPDKLQKLEERVYDLETRLNFNLQETNAKIEQANATANAAKETADQASQTADQARDTAEIATSIAKHSRTGGFIAMSAIVLLLLGCVYWLMRHEVKLGSLSALFENFAEEARNHGFRWGSPPAPPDTVPPYQAPPAGP